MKKVLFIVITLFLSAPIFAQQQGGAQDEQQGGQGQNQQRFQERKQKILERMNDRLQKVQANINCVNQAQNPKELRACRPQGQGNQNNQHDQDDQGDQNN